jgi:hypothetical protein
MKRPVFPVLTEALAVPEVTTTMILPRAPASSRTDLQDANATRPVPAVPANYDANGSGGS